MKTNETRKSDQLDPEVVETVRKHKVRSKIVPDLNKLFKNPVRSFFDPRFALKNIDTTKSAFNSEFGVSLDSKFYNYTSREIRMMSDAVKHEFPQELKQQISKLDTDIKRKIKGAGAFAFLVTAVGLGNRFIWKWGKLTQGKFLHYSIAYCFTLQFIDYLILDHAEDETNLMLKFNKDYEEAIRLYESV